MSIFSMTQSRFFRELAVQLKKHPEYTTHIVGRDKWGVFRFRLKKGKESYCPLTFLASIFSGRKFKVCEYKEAINFLDMHPLVGLNIQCEADHHQGVYYGIRLHNQMTRALRISNEREK